MGALGLLFAALGAPGCAEGTVDFEEEGAGASTSAATTAQGGAAGAISTGGSGGSDLPCGIDCSTISTPGCLQSVCNDGMHPGAVGECVIVPEDAGVTCDDNTFCTVDDACDGNGVCVGGPQNDCGMAPGPCDELVCEESSQSCTTQPLANGSTCTDTQNLCQVNTQCLNGVCVGDVKDCFFAPVPDDCHVAECNPMNGMCEPVVGNEGQTCTDITDLCTVNKTCMSGLCQGGNPKDCSQLTQGCDLGVCDTTTGQCTTMTVMNGQTCDDLNPCTNGEICSNGSCGGGTPVTQCLSGDACCPMSCTEQTDADCGCSVNLALTATPTSSGGGSGNFGPINFNDGLTGAQCATSGCSGCFGWISNSTTAQGKWVQYTWPSPVQIGSMFVEANACVTGPCYLPTGGRTINGAVVQYWNGSAWINATTLTSQNGNIAVTFNPKITTTQLRMYDVTAGSSCGQTSNSLIYEWYVYPGASCMPPP
jgi:hypothetical protein